MVESQFQEWYKDEMMLSDEELNSLEHYGVKGQKWGVRRTPEQLGHITEKKRKVSNWIQKARKKSAKRKNQAAKKKSEAKKAKAEKEEESTEKIREKVLNSTDPKYIYKHRDLLTTKELQDRLTRIDTEERVSKLVENTSKKGKDFIKVLGETAKMAESVGKIAENTKKVYDAYSTITSKKESAKFTKEGREEQRRKRERERQKDAQEDRDAAKKRKQEKQEERDRKRDEARSEEFEKIWSRYMAKSGAAQTPVSSLGGDDSASTKKKKKK